MTGFPELQRAFASAVLDAEAPVPPAIARKIGGVPSRRFAVYRNNVYAVDVLAGRFPVVARLVGEEFFRAMARLYVEREPPAAAVLIRYGASFPDFIAGFPPAVSVPYLSGIAALEWAWHSAYHAADTVPLPLQALASAADHAEDAVLSLHPSLGIVRSPYPIVSIYELNLQGGDVPPTKVSGAEDALVARPRLEVEIRRLPKGGAAFILALKEGSPIGEAAAIALREAPDFDLEANLAGLITSGAIIGLLVHASG
jgi:Putative DNA-binding domain